MRTSLVAVLCLAALASPGPAQDRVSAAELEPGELELGMLLEWEWVSSPRISPDGSRVVFRRSWVDKLHDRRVSDLWIVGADGARPRFLVRGSSPRWSPDGRRIAYLAEGRPAGTQIWVMWADTREATQITRVERAPSGIRWSPDGERIAFSMLVPERKAPFDIELPKRPKGAEWAPDPKVITRLSYRRDRSGYRPRGYRHLFVVDATGGTPRQVTSGDYDHRRPEWMPDGRHLVFSGLREEDADWRVRESEVYRVDVRSGAVRQLTDRAGPDSGPVPSPDGRFIAYTGYDETTDTYEVRKVHLMDADGSDPRVIGADLDRRPSGLMWSPGGEFLYFGIASEGTSDLYRARPSGEVTRVTRGRHRFRASDIGRDGTVVGTASSPHEPGDVVAYRIAADGTAGERRRLTRVNDDLLSRVRLGEVEEIRYRSSDGLGVQGWIVKPPDFDPAESYPLILQIHGGPHGMYGVDFSFERQNHAAEGFVVLYTNPRGSAGYGKEFGNAIDNAYPGKDYDDLMAGVDEVLRRGYADADRLFVYGGSGGGVLTAWIVGHIDRFRAAVSMYPVIDWISFVGTTDGPYWYTNFEKLPWEDITEHWNRSPLKYAGNVETPTLLITGELDLRTPMSQTEEFYQALKLRKVDTAMVRVPGEYHGASARPSNRMLRILYVREWFRRHMPEGGASPAEADARK